MAALRNRVRGLLAKLESTPGTDPTPDVTNNSIQTINLQIQPFDADTVEEEIDQTALGSRPSTVVKRRMRATFGCRMAGAGDSDTVPKWGPLIQACGFDAPTINSSDQASWALKGDTFSTLTMYGYIDGSASNLTRQIGTYGRGNLSWEIIAGQRPRWLFDFMGLFSTPTDVATPVFDYTGWQKSIPVTNVNTPTATLHGVACELISFTGSLNNQLEHLDLPNFAGIELVDRPIAGNIILRAPDVATKDWITSVDNETLGALQIIHGTAAGNTVTIDMPSVQLDNFEYGESQGFVTASIPWRALRSAADNDDMVITTS